MANDFQKLEDLGRRIEEIVDRAVNTHDYRKLNQTIRRTVERAVDAGAEKVKRAAQTPPPRPVYSGTVEPRNLLTLYGSTGGRTAAGIGKMVGGGVLSLCAFLATVSTGVIRLLTGAAFFSFSTAVMVGCIACGGALIVSGAKDLGRLGRFKTYRKALGQQTHIALEKLARLVGKNAPFVRRELKKMIGEGLFLEGHLDREEQNLITSHETYRHYERSRLELERRRQEEQEEQRRQEAARASQKAAKDPQLRDVLEKGNAFILEIRRCNDAIPGQEISEKISRMELIVQRIFHRAQAHPEIVPDLKKMMDYYLPMTVKLLNAYADMDAQPVQGQTIQSSKREIEQTLDTLNQAFEKLLDDAFKDTALDVSSDISVLQTLLAQEGLTEDELSKLRKNS